MEPLNILWLPHTAWRNPQRAWYFAEGLVLRHNVFVTNWDGDYTRWSDYLSKRYLSNFFPHNWQSNSVTIYHVPRVSPALFLKSLRALNQYWFKERILHIVNKHNIDVIVGSFVTPPPFCEVPLVTDIFDDNVAYWLAYGRNPNYASKIAASEDLWIKHSFKTVTVSSILKEKVIQKHPNAQVVHIPNGVDTSLYFPNKEEARYQLGLNLSDYYVGNIGSLNKLFEVDRLLVVAETLRPISKAHLLIVGEGHAMRYFVDELAKRQLSNVSIIGFVKGQKLVQYFQAIDVGLCPYKSTEGAHASVPMRLLYYIATGARVVCTKLKEVERMNFSNVMLSDDTHKVFSQKVLEALDNDPLIPIVDEKIYKYNWVKLVKDYEIVLKQAVKL